MVGGGGASVDFDTERSAHWPSESQRRTVTVNVWLYPLPASTLPLSPVPTQPPELIRYLTLVIGRPLVAGLGGDQVKRTRCALRRDELTFGRLTGP